MEGKLGKLSTRIEFVIAVLGFQEFTAPVIAKALAADENDVLHAMHLLHNQGVVELVRNRDAKILWRIVPVGAREYLHQSLPVSALAEAV